MFELSKIVLLLTVSAFVFTGCSSTSPSDDISVQSVKDEQKIIIIASSKEVLAGDSVNLRAEVFDSAGKLVNASPLWRIVNPDERTGALNRTAGDSVVFMAIKSGKALVESEYNQMKSTVEITVNRRPASVRMQAK